MNRLQQLHDAGVSIWLDTLSRELLDSGAFAALIADSAVTGATSNPTIFAKAITGSDAYDDQIRAAVASGVRDTQELFFALALDDVRHAADLLRPTYDASDGRDGFISFECTPDLADDTAATIEQALDALGAPRAAQRDDQGPRHRGRHPRDRGAHRPRRQRQRHAAVLRRALRAGHRRLPRRPRAAGDRAGSPSTPSPRSPRSSSRASTPRPTPCSPADSALRGRVAIANAHRAYGRYRERFADERWRALGAAGARPQRPLWASTGTKDPAYSDVLYVEELIAPGVVNTMPEATLRAFADHGQATRVLSESTATAEEVLRHAAGRRHRPRSDHRAAGTRRRAVLLRLLPRADRTHRDQDRRQRHGDRASRRRQMTTSAA